MDVLLPNPGSSLLGRKRGMDKGRPRQIRSYNETINRQRKESAAGNLSSAQGQGQGAPVQLLLLSTGQGGSSCVPHNGISSKISGLSGFVVLNFTTNV